MLYGLIFVFSSYIIIFGIILASISYYYTENKFFKGGILIFLKTLDDSLIVENGILKASDATLELVKNIPGEIIEVITNVLRPVVKFAKGTIRIISEATGAVINEVEVIGNGTKDAAVTLVNELSSILPF